MKNKKKILKKRFFISGDGKNANSGKKFKSLNVVEISLFSKGNHKSKYCHWLNCSKKLWFAWLKRWDVGGVDLPSI